MQNHNESTLLAHTADPSASARSVYDSVPLPLGDNVYIRVIYIHPSAVEDCSDRIVCEFSVLDIDKGERYNVVETSPRPTKIQYTALSYTWGDTPADRIIELNGQPFHVRRNLWDFLDRARKADFVWYVWIDALCIDQSTVRERNHQVALMGKIYSQAREVLVWLGDVPAGVEHAVNKSLSEWYADQDPSQLQSEYIEGAKAFCTLVYWTRAWIVQEYVLAKKILIWCGHFKMTDEALSWLFRDIWPGGLRVGMKRTAAMKIVNFREDWLCRTNRLDSGDGSGGLVEPELWDEPIEERVPGPMLDQSEFAMLLGRFGNNLHCADPRDRIFSLLSLLSEEGRGQLSIDPDYSKSPVELYMDVLDSFITIETTFTTHLDLLKAVDIVRDMLHLGDDEGATQLAEKAKETMSRKFETPFTKLRVRPTERAERLAKDRDGETPGLSSRFRAGPTSDHRWDWYPR